MNIYTIERDSEIYSYDGFVVTAESKESAMDIVRGYSESRYWLIEDMVEVGISHSRKSEVLLASYTKT